MKSFGVCAFLEINPRASYPAGDIFRSYRQHPIKRRTHLFVAAQSLVRERDLLKDGEVARIQLQCMVHFLERLFPTPLPPVDVGSDKWNARFVGEHLPRKDELLLGAFVIPVSPVIMLSDG